MRREFEAADLDGQQVVIAATDAPEVNAAVYRAAVERGVWSNSVDDIPNCDFFFGAVVRRGDLQIAISTAGESPAYAQRLRKEIDAQLAEDVGPWLKQIGEPRREILTTLPAGEERKALLHELAQDGPGFGDPTLTAEIAVRMGRPDRGQAMRRGRAARSVPGGRGAGRSGTADGAGGAADRELQNVILHDDLVPEAILELAREPRL